MKIVCIGGGPGGLYFAISAKLRDPSHDIVVLERNLPDDTFGWGVVLSDQTLDNLRVNDPVSAERIGRDFVHWDDIDVHFKGRVVTSTGHGFWWLSRPSSCSFSASPRPRSSSRISSGNRTCRSRAGTGASKSGGARPPRRPGRLCPTSLVLKNKAES